MEDAGMDILIILEAILIKIIELDRKIDTLEEWATSFNHQSRYPRYPRFPRSDIPD